MAAEAESPAAGGRRRRDWRGSRRWWGGWVWKWTARRWNGSEFRQGPKLRVALVGARLVGLGWLDRVGDLARPAAVGLAVYSVLFLEVFTLLSF